MQLHPEKFETQLIAGHLKKNWNMKFYPV